MKPKRTGGNKLRKTKVKQLQQARNAFVFLLCGILLALVMFCMLAVDNGTQVLTFIAQNRDNVITVGISLAVFVAITYCFFYFEHKGELKIKKIVELYILFMVAFAVCIIIGKFVNYTARPMTFFAITAVMIFSRREAIFLNTVFALMLYMFDSFLLGGESLTSFANLLTCFSTGMIAIFLFSGIKTRISSVFATFALLIPVLVVNLSILLPTQPDLGWVSAGETVMFCVLDCVLSVLIFMFVLPIFEVCFAELTQFRLRELTSDNSKIIKRLKHDAPGTYNHSLVVAQLAEACATAIGEDSELARAAAYYHDVGKLKNPEMFGENQNDVDLHKELTPELSVDIIRSHAKDGAKLINKNHLPEFFADVAVQHHGTMPIKYFYAKALKMSDGEINIDNYSYSGPTPTSKIAAIIMIADASEAAVRSLKERSHEKILALVNALVEERLNLDQFSNCDITIRELTQITQTVVSQLAGVYHSRVEYPKLVLSKKK